MFSFVWWIIGFYWITARGQALPTEAPHLYWYANLQPICFLLWPYCGKFIFHIPLLLLTVNVPLSKCRLCVVFLAFDVFFVVFCVALACVIGIAVCCCLPCIIAILYAVADQVLSLPPCTSPFTHRLLLGKPYDLLSIYETTVPFCFPSVRFCCIQTELWSIATMGCQCQFLQGSLLGVCQVSYWGGKLQIWLFTF
jgi:hypothetical protein